MSVYDDLGKCSGFHWDAGNLGKNWEKHGVTDGESEEIFFNHPLVARADYQHLVARADYQHSRKEPRYLVLGQTDAGRYLFVAFTMREGLIRVISARDMTRRELRVYTA